MSTIPRVRPATFGTVANETWEDRLIGHIHQQGVEDLVIVLSGVVHRPVKVWYEGHHDGSSGAGGSGPVSVAMSMMPAGRIQLELDRKLAACMVDMMVGGTGEREDAPFTDLEVVLIKRVLGALPEAVARWWDEVGALSPAVEGFAISNIPDYTRWTDGIEVVYELSYRKTVGHLRVFYEGDGLKRLLRGAARARAVPGGRQESASPVDLGNRVKDMSILVSARLGLLNLTMRQLMALDTGDVLITGTGVGQNVTVLIGGRPKFLGIPGRRGGQVAIQVTELLEGVNEGA